MTHSPPVPDRPRLASLDVLRGFALCGILVVNIPIIAADAVGPGGIPADTPSWLALVAEQRFLPIFALLFGIGFSLLVESAKRRSPRPRVVLLRRLVALLVIGLVHQQLWPGEILTAYAVIGLVFLLPSTWLPRWAVAVLAAALPVVSLSAGGLGPLVVVALFLIGSALVRYGVVERMDRSWHGPALVGAVFAVAAVPAMWWQLQEGSAGRAMGVSGLVFAGLYVCAVLVLMRTPVRPVLVTVFEPLGRMALTHYLTATASVTVAALLFGLRGESTAELLGFAAGVLVLQWGFTVLWLRRHRQGPAEWLWRRATWATWKKGRGADRGGDTVPGGDCVPGGDTAQNPGAGVTR